MGIPGVALALRDAWRGSASRQWPTVNGIVITSGVATVRHETTLPDGGHLHHAGHHGGRRKGRKAMTSTSSTMIRYRYTVNGEEFDSTRVYFGDERASSGYGVAHKISLRYPLGSTVHVRYNPQNPARSLLEPGVQASLLTALPSVPWLLIAALVLLSGTGRLRWLFG